MANSNGGKKLSQEQIVAQFNQLRQEQRLLASKIGELELEVSEHSAVIETLKDVDGDRKCFRLVGGVLVERTVKDVLPALVKNKEGILGVIATMKKQLTSNGEELNKFREKYNIKVHGEKDPPTQSLKKSEQSAASPAGVLVAGSGST